MDHNTLPAYLWYTADDPAAALRAYQWRRGRLPAAIICNPDDAAALRARVPADVPVQPAEAPLTVLRGTLLIPA